MGFLIEQWEAEGGHFPAIAYQSALAVLLTAQMLAWVFFVWPRRVCVAERLDAHPLHALARELELATAASMPYLRARQAWATRLLEAHRQRRSWRQVGLVSLAITGCLALLMIWGSMHAAIVPHVVAVAALREPDQIWRVSPSALLTAATPRSHRDDRGEGQTDGHALP